MADQAEQRGRELAEITAAQVHAAYQELLALLNWHVPQGLYGGEPVWRAIGLALLTRMADILDSMGRLLPTQRQSEALVLVRVLYEHVVTFCWLAIDPETRMAEWFDAARVERRKLHNDAKELWGVELVEEAEAAEAAELKAIPRVARRAGEVDDHWRERIRGFRGSKEMLSLRGLYTLVYRHASGTAHADAESLGVCLDPAKPPWRVNHERADNVIYSALAVPVFCHALLVCHEEFGWPPDEDVRRINDGLVKETTT